LKATEGRIGCSPARIQAQAFAYQVPLAECASMVPAPRYTNRVFVRSSGKTMNNKTLKKSAKTIEPIAPAAAVVFTSPTGFGFVVTLTADAPEIPERPAPASSCASASVLVSS